MIYFGTSISRQEVDPTCNRSSPFENFKGMGLVWYLDNLCQGLRLSELKGVKKNYEGPIRFYINFNSLNRDLIY